MHKIIYCFILLTLAFSCKNDVKLNTNDASVAAGTEGTMSADGSQNTSPNMTTSPAASNDVSNNPSASNATTTSSTVNNQTNQTTAPNLTSSPSTPVSNNQNQAANTQVKSAPQKVEQVAEPSIKYGAAKKSSDYSLIDPQDHRLDKNAKSLPIPDPCQLIAESSVQSLFGVSDKPQIKPGSKKPEPSEKSCFFKFEDPKKPNGGILLQIMTNPFPGEIEDYPAVVIQGKLNNGEQNPYDKRVVKFYPFNDVADGGCYSYEAGKYHWKIKDKYVFMLAFNTSHTEAQQKQIAITLGNEIMKKFQLSLK